MVIQFKYRLNDCATSCQCLVFKLYVNQCWESRYPLLAIFHCCAYIYVLDCLRLTTASWIHFQVSAGFIIIKKNSNWPLISKDVTFELTLKMTELLSYQLLKNFQNLIAAYCVSLTCPVPSQVKGQAPPSPPAWCGNLTAPVGDVLIFWVICLSIKFNGTHVVNKNCEN